jgi:hypothetical protein
MEEALSVRSNSAGICPHGDTTAYGLMEAQIRARELCDRVAGGSGRL